MQGGDFLYYAVSEFGERVHISNATPAKKYVCPLCRMELIQRRGKINTHHFAHYSRRNCDDWYVDKTEWHRLWQLCFPVSAQEQKIEIGSVKHIADVAINNVVIEFQHSSISAEDFQERALFYSCGGRKLIWVIDCRKDYESERILWSDEAPFGGARYKWYQPKKYLAGVIPRQKRGIEVFLQIDEETLLQIVTIACSYQGVYSYKEFSAYELNIDDFMEFVGGQINTEWKPKEEEKFELVQSRIEANKAGIVK